MAVGTHKILEYLQKFRVVSDRAVVPILLAVISVISYQNINFYMFEYRNNMYFENTNSEFAMETGLTANNIGDGYMIYILGSPRVFSSFPTLAFLTQKDLRTDITAEDLATLKLKPDQKVAFFAIPENSTLIDEISLKFPGGNRGVIYRKPRPNVILFEYYILAP